MLDISRILLLSPSWDTASQEELLETFAERSRESLLLEALSRYGLAETGLPASGDDDSKAALFWDTAFEVFERVDDPDFVVSVLVREDLQELMWRMFLLDGLQEDTPLFSVSEQNRIFELLLQHQELNKDSLIKDGLPAEPFVGGGPWHRRLLSLLYPLQSSFQRPVLSSELSGPAELETLRIDQGSLPLKDQSELPNLRRRVHAVKVAALKGMIAYLKALPPTDSAVDACFEILGRLSPSDTVACFELENLHKTMIRSAHNASTGSFDDASCRDESAGGVLSLIAAAGLCEQEVRIGILDRTRGTLGRLYPVDWNDDGACQTREEKLEYLNFVGVSSPPGIDEFTDDELRRHVSGEDSVRLGLWQLWGPRIRPYVDRALDTYVQLEPEANKHWRSVRFKAENFRIARNLDVELDSISGPTEFIHSPEYGMVRIRGETFWLTATQARVIEYLHEYQKYGTPELLEAHVATVCLSSDRAKLKDLFKRDKKAYRELIRSGRRRGTKRLNLP